MTKIKKSSTKGNDGKASVKRLQQKITIALTGITSFLLVLHFIGILPNRENVSIRAIRAQGIRRPKITQYKPSPPARRVVRENNPSGILPMTDALSDPNYDPRAKVQVKQILSASTQLIDLDFENDSIQDNSYSGIIATFCPLNFAAQKENPPEVPMFKDVIAKSQCDELVNKDNLIKVDLAEAVSLAREFDADVAKQNKSVQSGAPKVLNLKGVVFHESRCGSTLAANSMMALNPEKHRVYSESAPPIIAIKACGEDFNECSVDAVGNLLRDVVYMMSRSNDPNEENLFFKIQSVGTRNMAAFRKAFPITPWIFLYREPVQVMMSQLDMPKKHIPQANCVRSRKHSPLIKQFVKREGYNMADLSYEEFCSVHLATICESALENIEDAEGMGLAVKYSPDLVHTFLDTIFPKHFHTPVDDAGNGRVLEVSGTYSKNRGDQPEGSFHQDSEEKEKNASSEIKDASRLFLQPSFDLLGESPYNVENL